MHRHTLFFISHVVVPLVAIYAVWRLLESPAVAITLLVLAIVLWWTPIYRRYAQDNPKKLWFKRKLYGWGWTPATWQGWLITLAYVALISAFAMTIDQDSPPREVAFTFGLPFLLLTAAFIRIAYKKGEKPRWQWGDNLEKYQ